MRDKEEQLEYTRRSYQNELERKQQEANQYRAQYYFELSLKVEALSYINELELVMNGTEPKSVADIEDSKEELRQKYHLVKKQNKVRPVEGCN